MTLSLGLNRQIRINCYYLNYYDRSTKIVKCQPSSVDLCSLEYIPEFKVHREENIEMSSNLVIDHSIIIMCETGSFGAWGYDSRSNRVHNTE